MKIAVVIPNWNGADLLNGCLNSLKQQSYKAEVVVVDNGSVDSSVELIEKQFGWVTLIKLAKNTGFTGGVNTGIKYALKHGFEAVALLNNDAMAGSDWIKNLAAVLQKNPQAGIVTSKIMRLDKKHFDTTGDFYSIWGMPFPRGRNQLDRGQYDEPESVFGATGGASLYRANMLSEIGLFDDKFFAYFEDVDMSFRARLADWEIVYEPHAVVYHHVSATSAKLGTFSRYHSIKNFYALYFKNMPGILFLKYWPLFLIQAARLGASSLIRGSGWAYARGFGRFLLNLPEIIKDRRHIQSKRKVTPKEIDRLLYRRRPPRIPAI